MNCKWIIGISPFLEIAHGAWQRAFPQRHFIPIAVPQDALYAFDLSALDALSPQEGSVFVAIDARFGNFKRMELIQAVTARGLELASFVGPQATVASEVQIGPNAFIGDGATVGHGSSIGTASVVLSGAHVGSAAHIDSACWLEAGAIVGDGAYVGSHCILRSGAIVAPKVSIGASCELGWPQRYGSDVAAKTYFDPRYDQPIYTYQP